MGRLGNSVVAKILLLFCVAMQVVALMPHHHHGDAVHVCFNYSHVAASGQCEDYGCTELDVRDRHSSAACITHSIVVAQPEERDDNMEETVTDHLPDCCCPCCAPDLAAFIAESRVVSALVKYSGEFVPQPYLRIYLTAALPCRAPDFKG